VKPFAIVLQFNIFEYMLFCLGAGYKFIVMYSFSFKAVTPAFHQNMAVCNMAVSCLSSQHQNQWLLSGNPCVSSRTATAAAAVNGVIV
jgi:hypothetical protein